MAIRITGMYSGLDTESIINELASAQSYKKTKLVKQQKSYSWKMDAWKALNTKVYSFYQKLDDLRLQSSYLKKKTTVSNPTAVKVVSGEGTVDGVHTLKVNKLAKRAYMTSASLETDDGTCFRSSASLKQLGFSGSGSINVVGAQGQSVEISVNDKMTINQFVEKLKKTGLNASFDEENQRFYISSKDTGEPANFFITGNDEGGFQALAALGLLTGVSSEDDKAGLAYKDLEKWASYNNPAAGSDAEAAKAKLIADMVKEREAAYKAQDKDLQKKNEELDKANVYNQEKLEALEGYAAYGQFSSFTNKDGSAITSNAELKAALYDKIYGEEVEVQKKDKDGNPMTDKDGNPVMEKVRQNGLTQALEDAKKDLAEKQKEGSGASEQDIEDAKKAVEDAQKELKKANDCYSFVNALATNDATKAGNTKILDEHAAMYGAADDSSTYSSKLEETITAEVNTKAAAAAKAKNGDYLPKNADGSVNTDKLAHKIEGRDAEIMLNGVKYTSYNNTISVNGMTITVMEETDKEVTLSTSTDTDGVYDMIKDLFTSYNELINEMDSLYNAESSKGYDPLTAEEKESLTEEEIAEWEKKIKDSVLRRDSTLSTVASSMKSVMLKGVSVGGRQMYLSDFGIATLGYFTAKENERNAFHIDGDPDDTSTKSNDDVLRSMIAKDPNTVMEFFTGLANNMHDELFKKMSATKMSSALTVYNDKQMKIEYDKYAEKIKKEEDKLNALVDKWYARFSTMESALAKLESKNNSLSSLFGG